jgi:hypothetical protein
VKPAAIILTLLTFTSSIYAQLVSDGAMNMLANVTNTITGTVTVGTNGAFTLLVLSDNVPVTNSAHGAIGRNASERLILIQHADGESNLTYGIEFATNLAPPIFRERIGTNAADRSGVFQVTDTNAPSFPMRFYRALFLHVSHQSQSNNL